MEQDFIRPGAYNLLGSGNGSLGDEMNKSISPPGRGKLWPVLCRAQKSQEFGFSGVFLCGSWTGSRDLTGGIGHRDPRPGGRMSRDPIRECRTNRGSWSQTRWLLKNSFLEESGFIPRIREAVQPFLAVEHPATPKTCPSPPSCLYFPPISTTFQPDKDRTLPHANPK